MEMHEVSKQIKQLLRRLDGRPDSVVCLHENMIVDPVLSKGVLDTFVEVLDEGTVCVMGDASLNEKVSQKQWMQTMTNQERILLSSGRMLQLLVLKDASSFANHPSVVMGTYGKYARFFSRQVEIDFPYGTESVFEDMYELNAILVFVGEPIHLDLARFVSTKLKRPIVCRNTCIVEEEVHDFLDYDVDVDHILDALMRSDLLLYEELNGQRIYGVKYQDLIRFAETVVA